MNGTLRTSASQRTFPFLMLKEIYEQPEAIRKTIEQHFDPATGSVRLDKFPFALDEVQSLRKVTIAASGSSRHAGLCGKIMIEELAGIPVEVGGCWGEQERVVITLRC